ncbi:MAG: hypothetical protein KF802_02410 [Bdellovibrionaceae bacterium]|nr:hypothetical protein [Pseudobdellovibrionaceae bacterium]
MKKNNVVMMRVDLAALISRDNGEVHVVLSSSLMGDIVCKVTKSGETLGVQTVGVQKKQMLNELTDRGLHTFYREAHRMAASAVQSMYVNSDDWLVIAHEPHYDILSPKEGASPELIAGLNGGLKSRFPLFREHNN